MGDEVESVASTPDNSRPNSALYPTIHEGDGGEIYNRHLPLPVRNVCHAEIVPTADPWRSDLKLALLLPFHVEARSLSGQVLQDEWWDVAASGCTVQIGYLTVASPDVEKPAPLATPETVFTIVVPLTRGRHNHPFLDKIKINPEYSYSLHHTVKVPGVTRSGRSCVFRVRTKIDPETGEACLASINPDPYDTERVKDSFVNFAQMCKRAGRAIKRAFAKEESETDVSTDPNAAELVSPVTVPAASGQDL
jgi:hypothetical protein